MVSLVVKLNKILTFLVLTIAFLAIFLLVIFKIKSKDNLSPENYLKSLGYEIELIDEKQVNIPKKFGEGLKEYNELQLQQGFDLKKYSGKDCIQKQYYVTSKKVRPEKYVANVIVYKNKVIAGDLHSKYYDKKQQKPLKLTSIK